LGEPDILKEIKRYKHAVLAACAGAYLHNLGKVSREFNLQQSSKLKGYFYQQIAGILRKRVEKNPDLLEYIQENIRKTFNTKNDHTTSVFQEDTRKILQKEFPILMPPFDDRSYCPGDLIEFLGQGTPDLEKKGWRYNWARIYYTIGANNADEVIKTIKAPGKHKYYIEEIVNGSSLLTHLMNRCHHGASGGEKNEFYFLEQEKDIPVFMATPFGFEVENAGKDYKEYDEYREKTEQIIAQHLGANSDALKLGDFINSLKPVFRLAMADSRRPHNNISVHDMGHSGMALLKSALWTLKGKALTHDSFWMGEGEWLSWWRLLSFSLDGLGYLSEAVSIADLRVRIAKLEKYRCSIRSLLEEEYPVATEVYRDENSSIFVFPNWDESSSEAKSIIQLIDKRYGFHGEKTRGDSLAKVYGLEPQRQISSERCMVHPGDAREAGVPYIGTVMQKMILSPLPAIPVPEAFISTKSTEKPETDLCPYCGLRLISKREEARKSCQVCLKERSGVAKKWWENKRRGTIGLEEIADATAGDVMQAEVINTIWLEEIADDNGRLALVVGRFFPECFLELDFLPDKKQENVNNKKMSSAEAFARQRRIWETCREFWHSVEKDIGTLILSDHTENRERLHIKVTTAKANGLSGPAELSKYHAYELLIDGIRLTAMWTGDGFITLENLQGFRIRNRLDEEAKDWLEKHKDKPITIRIPGGYGSKAAIWGHADINEIEKDDSGYLPAMSILTEPRTFMSLVPASKAFAIAKSIKSKYEKEMGQVRGRMPLHLGLIYADRYTPLRAVLDAGRRMLNQKAEAVKGKLLYTPQKDESERWQLYWQIEGESTPICWSIDFGTYGDSRIENDWWYPYFPVCELAEREEEGSALKLTEHQTARVFGAYSDKEIKQMIHVEKLCKGDQVYLYPSTFDFEYLDNAGTRFEIAYEQRKRKSRDRAQRAYLLEQIDELDRIWDLLGKGALKRNQVYALRDAISGKRYEWKQSFNLPDETFKRYCRDIFVTAAWNKVQLKGQEKAIFPWEKFGHEKFFDQWADYAVRGLFEDVVQLRLQIMKDKIE
jgi:hypothetical protein